MACKCGRNDEKLCKGKEANTETCCCEAVETKAACPCKTSSIPKEMRKT